MTTTSPRSRADAGEARFGMQVAALLNAHTSRLPDEVDARLRQIRCAAAARQQPQRRGWLRLGAGRTAVLGARHPGWQLLLGLALALPVLVLGLQFAQSQQRQNTLSRLADVDTALLLDDVPPQAYLDPGFKSYLAHRP